MKVSFLSISDRGQTEPIAALVAVSAFAIALSLFGVAVMDVLDRDTDRAIEEPTMEVVWEDMQEHGVYNGSAELENEIKSPDSLPRGHYVEIRILVIADDGDGEDGIREPIDQIRYNASGGMISQADDPPPNAGTSTRPIPVRTSPGEVHTMILEVTVWE